MQAQSNRVSPQTTHTYDAVQKSIEMIHPLVKAAWANVAPVWPLKNVIACNPLQGLEHLDFEDACEIAAEYYQQPTISDGLAEVNRLTIKWCQAFFDDGQATLSMPGRYKGFYPSWRELAAFDEQLHHEVPNHKVWLSTLSNNPNLVIVDCLARLQVPSTKTLHFLTLMLTSLPGWAGYIKYRLDWSQHSASSTLAPVTPADYLAIRLVITCLIWPDAYQILTSPMNALNRVKNGPHLIADIMAAEQRYARPLLQAIYQQSRLVDTSQQKSVVDAQIVFCIDVRSEPFRRALEAQGAYETLGFAGFFGLPVSVRVGDAVHAEPSCPVLLSPKHIVNEVGIGTQAQCRRNEKGKKTLQIIKRSYHGLKYTFTTNFGLVEASGPCSGFWMLLKTLWPTWASKLSHSVSQWIRSVLRTTPMIDLQQDETGSISGITFEDQCDYAASALSTMGLVRDFAPIVVFCGHGSTSHNNAYATALDCGACGGRSGGINAQILANILNKPPVRHQLAQRGIVIPKTTSFIAAEHNTTTDAMTLFEQDSLGEEQQKNVQQLIEAFKEAQKINALNRCALLGVAANSDTAISEVIERSVDWAQTQPEWGLAGNAAFIVAPRELTHNIDLQGRAFLHSYRWQDDVDGKSLETILTAPLVVAQWINSQYFFSTLDNVAFGSGSKITQNITGKIGVMQGNASDLMHGLPLQSVYKNDHDAYHESIRLLTVVHAPTSMIDPLIARQPILQKLFGHGWVHLAVIDPSDHTTYRLQRDLTWKVESLDVK